MATLMNHSPMPMFRVHAAGLNQVEKAVLSGLLHLAEAQGIRFKMEEQADCAHIFVLEASHPSAAALSRAIAQFEQRVIWVDLPAELQAGREIRRPLRWPALLELMVQAGREYDKPPRPSRQRPIAMIEFGRLCALCEIILRGHFGAEAERLVRLARAEMEEYAAANKLVGTHVFLHMLKKRLPEKANGEKILREIVAAIARAGCQAQRCRQTAIGAT